jgi:hypothetical protein
MFDDYLKAILVACEKKKDEEKFPLFLSHPTPGNFRKECITVYRERYLSSDDEILRSFFGATDKEKGYSKIIDNSKADEFRQMPKILREEINNPGLKYIELLAWLIDFNLRPNTLYYRQANINKTTNHSDTLVLTEEEPNEQNSGELQVTDHHTDETRGQKTETAKPIRRIPIYTVAISCIALFLVASATFFFWKKKPDIAINTLFTSQKCMYWTGDHYEAVDCNEKVSDAPIVSLDVQKLTNFKKITSPDTLTKDALGKVWYTKIAGEHQFFTDSGVHPLDTQKKLRPLSRYILSNHVSYYRYLLTLLIWSISVIIFFGLCSVLFIAFWKKHKKKTLALGSPEELTALLLPSFQPNQETSNR